MSRKNAFVTGWLQEELEAATEAVDQWPSGMRSFSRGSEALSIDSGRSNRFEAPSEIVDDEPSRLKRKAQQGSD